MLLRDNVYESLRIDILTCRLAPGNDMREQELAERYAVSVANVRGHDPTQLVAEHVALIEAMQRRDARCAARIIKTHISQTEKRVLPALKRNAVVV
jgi:DNA-binding GntR family transcriptional regulator